MTDSVDERIAAAIHRAAPATRDPLFRIEVLERREIERYRRGVRLLVALAVAAVGGFVVAAITFGPGALAAIAAAMFAALASVIGFHSPWLLRRLAQLRR